MIYRASTAWSLLALTLGAWCFVVFFAWTIYVDESERLAEAQNAKIISLERASATRTHALAVDTAQQSEALGKILAVDVVSIANMLEAAGKAAKVGVKLGNAVPENFSASDPLPVQAVGFVVEAKGTFSALMHAARLFEKLPLPSTVTRLDFEHVPTQGGKGAGEWHMNAHIRVLTTSDIASRNLAAIHSTISAKP